MDKYIYVYVCITTAWLACEGQYRYAINNQRQINFHGHAIKKVIRLCKLIRAAHGVSFRPCAVGVCGSQKNKNKKNICIYL